MTLVTRRTALKSLAGLAGGVAAFHHLGESAEAAKMNSKWEAGIQKGLKWVARTQSRLGHWTAGNYPTAMTALAGTALTCSGSTTTQGPHAKNVRRCVDYLITKCRPNGLIGDPLRDNRYTYGHGFAMLFLSQVLGEEENIDSRDELVKVLTKAVEFSVRAQTKSGGWGYVSAADGNNFDEGSTTITQVQGLRGCRNAGIVVPKDAINKAREYIYKCQNKDGGISYSSRNTGSSRPAITAAALATLNNAGDNQEDKSRKEKKDRMLAYCKKNLKGVGGGASSFGHWHYTYLYYSQVMYREGDDNWDPFRDKLYDKIIGEQGADGGWSGNIGPIYVTACNLIMLQLDKGYLPIYQR